jgi:hypothetical protein
MTVSRSDRLQKQSVSSQRESGEDYAERLLAQFTNPEIVVDRFAPQVLDRVAAYEQILDFVKRFILSAVVIISALQLIYWFPGDLARERKTAIYYDQQRQRDCFAEYLQNNCNETHASDSPICIELETCLANPDEGVNQVSFVRFLWNLINAFFYPLSPKAAVVLGIIAGLFLYRDLRRPQ